MEADAFLTNMEVEMQGLHDSSTQTEPGSSDLQPHNTASDYGTIWSNSFVVFVVDGNVFQV